MHARPPPSTFPKRRYLRWLAGGIGVVVLLGMSYLIGLPWLLDSHWLQQRLSRLPGVTISWSAASSPSLDRLDVRNLTIRRADENLAVALEVDRARLHLSWWALLFRRLEIHSLEAEGLRSLEINEHRLMAGATSRVRFDDLTVDEEKLGVGGMELALKEARIQRMQGPEDHRTLARDIRLQGEFSLQTFQPDQAPGLSALKFLSGDLEVAAEADAWDVFNPYLAELDGLRLAGRGNLQGRLAIAKGVLLADSELTLDSPQLALDLDEKALLAPKSALAQKNGRRYRLEGRGQVTARIEKQEGAAVSVLTLSLDNMRMVDLSENRPFLTSKRFQLSGDLPQLDLASPPRALNTAALVWQDARLPDAAALARYLPKNLPFDLHGGKARLDARLDYRDDRLQGGFELSGDSVDLTLLGRRIASELGLDVKLVELNPLQGRLNLSGTRLRVRARNSDDSVPLQTELLLREARLTLASTSNTAIPPLAGRVVLQGRVAELGFFDKFLPRAHSLALSGNGLLEAELILQGDTLQPGSRLWISADPLGLEFLDYEASGSGRVEATIDSASGNVVLRIALPAFALRSQGSGISHVSGHHLLIETTLSDTALREALSGMPPTLEDQVTRISLPRLEVPDLRLYNAYLPQDAGVELLSGQASLEAYLDLQGYQARGDLVLNAFEAALRIGDQRMQGDIGLQVRLAEGDLQRRWFDVSGSTLRLDNLSRQGGSLLHQAEESGWWVELKLEAGQLLWAQPLNLNAGLALRMRDSGFPLRLLLEDVRQRKWLNRVLTVRNIQGRARLQLADKSLALRDARLTGQQLEILADLVRQGETLDGALYAGYAALGLGLEIDDGETRLHLIKPRRWYEQARHLPAAELDLEVPPLEESGLQGPAEEDWYRALPLSPVVSDPLKE
ncbi:hypothetical protein [Pistricoccus aurantiacus]|uniref:hypothetical protein n=1 Tax=Pistricoccus aurantiacus TaxID=1883414 RepID=UPI00362C336B